MAFVKGLTVRGVATIIHQSYEYRFFRIGKNHVCWRCTRRCCTAKLKTSVDECHVLGTTPHNHSAMEASKLEERLRSADTRKWTLGGVPVGPKAAILSAQMASRFKMEGSAAPASSIMSSSESNSQKVFEDFNVAPTSPVSDQSQSIPIPDAAVSMTTDDNVVEEDDVLLEEDRLVLRTTPAHKEESQEESQCQESQEEVNNEFHSVLRRFVPPHVICALELCAVNSLQILSGLSETDIAEISTTCRDLLPGLPESRQLELLGPLSPFRDQLAAFRLLPGHKVGIRYAIDYCRRVL